MKVIRPITVTQSMVTTDATNTYSDWLVGTTYALNDIVVYDQDGFLYQSLQASNTGNTPDETNSAWWVKYGTSNKWSMFDDQTSTYTARTTSITTTVDPAGLRFNSIGLIGLNAIQVDVTVDDAGGELFNQTYDLDETFIDNWYAYFYEPYLLKTDLVVTGITTSATATAEVIITNTTGLEARCGAMVMGIQYELGETEMGMTYGITDYSVKETDEFGVSTFVQRGYAETISANVLCDNSSFILVSNVLSSLRATPTVWSFTDRSILRPTTVYGYARDWGIDIAYTNHSLLSLEIEGLT